MRKSRFTEEQIRLAVEQAAAGAPIPELCRKYGVSPATFYRWRTKYDALTKGELQRREHVTRVAEAYAISVRKACRALDWPRSSHHYKSRKADTTALRMRMRELALARPRYGYRRIHILLGREGWHVNHKKILRIYREEGLSLRIRRKKRKSASWTRVPPPRPSRPDERWALDFMSDALVDGSRFRVLAVIDVCTRQCVALDAARSFPAARVTAVLDRSIAERSQPRLLTTDNGTEFTSKRFDAWAYKRGIGLDFIRPSKPVENCFIESFNGQLRDECLNMHWFAGLDEARQVLEDWPGWVVEVDISARSRTMILQKRGLINLPADEDR